MKKRSGRRTLKVNLRDQQAERSEDNAHLHIEKFYVVLNPLKPVLEVADGDNKINPQNPKKDGDRHGNFSYEF
ncbi:hypothetical protein B6U64_08695 [Ligilactobacillus salivarius]|nr:hypothetical protein B6U64_08695 [Ligilactobacillus salivarius]